MCNVKKSYMLYDFVPRVSLRENVRVCGKFFLVALKRLERFWSTTKSYIYKISESWKLSERIWLKFAILSTKFEENIITYLFIIPEPLLGNGIQAILLRYIIFMRFISTSVSNYENDSYIYLKIWKLLLTQNNWVFPLLWVELLLIHIFL